MPFTVLKVAQGADKKSTEVMGEWESAEDAHAFAEDARRCDPECEYHVEPPPPRQGLTGQNQEFKP
jgi:hypothetical protein